MKTVTETMTMKRKLGIAALAAVGALAFTQLAHADGYDFWAGKTPTRAELRAAALAATPVASDAASEEVNEVTAVAPKRAAAAQPASAKSPVVAQERRNAAVYQSGADPYSAM